MKKKKIGILFSMLLVIPIVTATVALSSEEPLVEDSHLFSFRTARATDKGVKNICVEYIAQEDKNKTLEFPEQVRSYENSPDGGGYRTAGSTHCGEYTCGVTDCYTNGCYTCYPSAGCYQTCYSNPCTYDNCPTNSGPTCGGATCEGTCPGDGYSCDVFPCGKTLQFNFICILKFFANDPF
jgi:hypothetical protein